MLATTTITWAMLIASYAPTGQMQATTAIQGFGSQEACHLAIEITQAQLPEAGKPVMLCVPVDAARPLPNALHNLQDLIEKVQ